MGFAERYLTQFDTGRKNRDIQAINRLTGQALSDPSQAAALLPQIAERDAAAALKLQDSFQGQEDRKLTRQQNFASIYSAAPPEARPLLQQRYAADFGFDPADPEFDNVVSAWARGSATGGDGLSPRVRSLQWAREQGHITDEQFKQGLLVEQGLAPGASAPGLTYVDQWDHERGVMTKIPVLTRGLDYTGSAPSLTGGSPQPSGPPQPAPGTREFTIDPSEEVPFPTDPAEIAAAQEAMTTGGTFVVGPDGRPQRVGAPGADLTAPSPQRPASAPQPTPQPAVNRPLPPLSQWGAGDERAIVSGPSNAEKLAQTEAEAAAGVRGRMGAERDFGPNFEQEASLRKEYTSTVSEPKAVLGAYQKVRDAGSSRSAAGDMSMIFAYMKMLDPTSTVREGEYASARDTTGIPGRVLNLYNQALDGQFLSQAQRAGFIAEAQKLAASAEKSIAEANEYYSGIAPQYGIDPTRIVRPEQGSAPAEQESYEPGDVIEAGGKRYRALTGGPDPELEEI